MASTFQTFRLLLLRESAPGWVISWSLELIGDRLLVSEKTVKNCVTTLFRKEPLRRAPPQILA
jgi:hypothetical protein